MARFPNSLVSDLSHRNTGMNKKKFRVNKTVPQGRLCKKAADMVVKTWRKKAVTSATENSKEFLGTSREKQSGQKKLKTQCPCKNFSWANFEKWRK